MQRLAVKTSSAEMLRAYNDGMVEVTADHRSRMKALLEIFLGGGLHFEAGTERVGLPFLLNPIPDLDSAAYDRELVTLFELGTRRSPP